MRKEHYYHVYFDLVSVHYRRTEHYQIDVEAFNQNDAKEIAREIWERDGNGKHMFHLSASRFKDGEEVKYTGYKYIGCTKWLPR